MLAIKKANNAHQKNYRTYLFINAIGYLGIGVHLALILLFFLLGMPLLSFINLFSFLIWTVAWRINQSGKHDLSIGLMVFEVVIHTLFVVPIMGLDAGFQYYLIGTIPFCLFSTQFNGRLIVLTSIGICLTFTSLDLLTPNAGQSLIAPLLKSSILQT